MQQFLQPNKLTPLYNILDETNRQIKSQIISLYSRLKILISQKSIAKICEKKKTIQRATMKKKGNQDL